MPLHAWCAGVDALGLALTDCRADEDPFQRHFATLISLLPLKKEADRAQAIDELIALIEDISLRSPNDARKIGNLRTYATLAKERYSDAALSLIAVTDGRDLGKFGQLQEELVQLPGVHFKQLPLHIIIGGWIEPPNVRPEPVVDAFAQWAKLL